MDADADTCACAVELAVVEVVTVGLSHGGGLGGIGSCSPPPQEPPLKVVLSRAQAQSAETDVPTGVGKWRQWWLAVG